MKQQTNLKYHIISNRRVPIFIHLYKINDVKNKLKITIDTFYIKHLIMTQGTVVKTSQPFMSQLRF